jgi:hypothetical protein
MGACAVIEEAIAQAVLGGRVGGTGERLREPVDGRCLRWMKTMAASSLQGPLMAPGLVVGLYSRKEEVCCSMALVGSGAVWRGASTSRAEQSESRGECESGRRRKWDWLLPSITATRG